MQETIRVCVIAICATALMIRVVGCVERTDAIKLENLPAKMEDTNGRK